MIFAERVCAFVSPSLHWFLSKVSLTLKKLRQQVEAPFLLFHVTHLGIDVKVRKFDLCATTYIKEVTMKSLEFKGQTLTSHDPGSVVFWM